ncbi:hypothetical protein RDWZM_006973 [Blomia tropicalis]|uniref:Vacuolar protein sorting-associated protein 33B n=1 Tax=Blomia tropicalis TaxID=40697 RepID=A0A9Q0M828_BLOTA|nr:hypothetical protein RDWZM_006973 [Blomia tropicalis]
MEFISGSIPSILKNAASTILLSVLEKIEGQKDIVLCDQLISSIDLVCSFKDMKNIGVDKIFKLENAPINNSKRYYTCEKFEKACSWVNLFQNKDLNDLQYWIIFVPQKSYVCERYLEQEGLFGYFTILDFPLGFMPLDSDLFSLESDDSYQDFLLFGDYHFLNNVALCLYQFQKLIGPVNLLFGKGRASEFICDYLMKMNALNGLIMTTNQDQANAEDYLFDLLIVDREEDYASLFLSQLNYCGILDETFPIRCGKIELDSEVIKDTQMPAKHQLFGADQIYGDIQNQSFSSVCVSLKEKGQRLRQKYHERQSMNLNEMKEFLNKDLKNIQSEHKALFLHINICEKIMERKKQTKFSDQLKMEQNIIEGIESRSVLNFIEDGIIKLYPKMLMLRLICLYSICYGGFSTRDLNHLMKLFGQSYGFDCILWLFNLKKIGIIFETTNQFNFNVTSPTITSSISSTIPKLVQQSSSSSPSETIRKFRHNTKKFNLIPLLETESYNIRAPTDCGYVFGGAYYPFVCKLLDSFFNLQSMSQIDDWSRQSNCKLQPSLIPNQHNGRSLSSKNKRIQLVLFVGGVTYAEVSALRFLSRQKEIPILIMTTSICNGNNFLNSFMKKSF